MEDLSRAIRYIRKHAGEFCVDPGRVLSCGFSAGGHLCGSVCVHYNDIADKNEKYTGLSNRPDAAILSYPSFLPDASRNSGSFHALLGMEMDPETGEQHCTGTEAELEYMSLEKHVTPDTPPCFLWQTAQTSRSRWRTAICLQRAAERAACPMRTMYFPAVPHGLSLADEVWASPGISENRTQWIRSSASSAR